MNVSLVSGSCPPIKCGIGDYTARLVHALGHLGTAATVLTSTGATAVEHRSGSKVIPLIEVWGWRQRHAILAALSQQSPEVVNIQYPTQQYGRRMMINLLPHLVARSLKVPVVFTVHEYSTFTILGRTRIALSAATSRALIVPDRENLTLLGREFPFLRRKLHHVPIGPNIEPVRDPGYDREEWRSRFAASPCTTVIAYFGFLSQSKGVEILIEALENLYAADRQLDWRFLLIADRQPANHRYAAYHNQIEDLLKDSPIRGRTHWTGYCSEEDVSRYLKSADLCVLPFSDGATLRRTTLLTAFAHGLPVVSTLPKHKLDPSLRDDHTLALVPAGDASALAGRIKQLLQDPQALDRLGQGAIEAAESMSWHQVARGVLQVYETARQSIG